MVTQDRFFGTVPRVAKSLLHEGNPPVCSVRNGKESSPVGNGGSLTPGPILLPGGLGGPDPRCSPGLLFLHRATDRAVDASVLAVVERPGARQILHDMTDRLVDRYLSGRLPSCNVPQQHLTDLRDDVSLIDKASCFGVQKFGALA